MLQFLLLLNTTRMLEKDRLSCMYIQLSKKIDKESLIFAVPRSLFRQLESFEIKSRDGHISPLVQIVYIVVNVFLIMYRFKILYIN